MNAMEQTQGSSSLLPIIEKWGGSLCGAIDGAVCHLTEVSRRQQAIRQFEALDDRVLRDIGRLRNGGRLH
jgi:hypothetical protein